jgi:hypothetical protein
MLMKSLLSVSAILSLAPTAAFASDYGPQCYEVCEPYSGCSEPCLVGLGTWISCGEFNPDRCVPSAADPTDPTASVTGDEAHPADGASQVCSEKNRAATAES